MGVHSKKFQYGSRTICAGFPSSQGFGVGRLSKSNFSASAVLQGPPPTLWFRIPDIPLIPNT